MAAPALEAVLSGAAGPGGVRLALRSSPLRRSMRRAIAGLLLPGTTLGPVRIGRVKLKPGRKLSVWGRAALVDEHGCRFGLPVAITWVAPSRLAAPPDDAEAHLLEPGPLAAWHAVDEAAGMELLTSPFDPAAPELVGLLAPGAVPERPRVTTVRYRPRQRHVLRYDGEQPGEEPRWAKLVPGREGAVPEAAANALADGLDGTGNTVLRPLQLLDGGAVLYPHAPGRPLRHLLVAMRSVEPLRHCGEAVGQLHELPAATLPFARVATLDDELAGVARAGEHLAELHPAAHRVLDAVLDRARAGLSGPPVEPAPAHGDCKLDHLWVDDGAVTFIDVDSAVLAEPARDLGKLLADLRWWGPRAGVADLAAAQAAVVAGYDACGSDPERRSRAAAWEGLWLAKAVVRRTSLLDRTWEARTLAGLREAEGLLAAPRPDRTTVAAR